MLLNVYSLRSYSQVVVIPNVVLPEAPHTYDVAYLARICSAICPRRAYLRNPTIEQTYCSIHVPCIKVFQSILVFATIWLCHMKVQTLSLDALPQLCPPPPITHTVSHTVCIKAPSLVVGSQERSNSFEFSGYLTLSPLNSSEPPNVAKALSQS